MARSLKKWLVVVLPVASNGTPWGVLQLFARFGMIVTPRVTEA